MKLLERIKQNVSMVPFFETVYRKLRSLPDLCTSKKKRKKNIPPRHNHSPILQRRLHRIIPSPVTPPISRPSLEHREFFFEIAVDEGQEREHRQQDIGHERRDHRRERRRESTQC